MYVDANAIVGAHVLIPTEKKHVDVMKLRPGDLIALRELFSFMYIKLKEKLTNTIKLQDVARRI